MDSFPGGLPPGFPPVPEDFNPEELGFPPNVDRNFAWVLFLQTVAAQQQQHGHGHSHGGQPCHGHGGGDEDEEEAHEEDEDHDPTGAAIEEMMHAQWEGDLLDKDTAFECFKEITAMSVTAIEDSLKPESMQAAMNHPEGMQGFIAESMEKKVKDIYAKYNIKEDAQLHATLGHYAKEDPEFALKMREEDEKAMGALSQATGPMLGGMMGGPMGGMGMPGMPMPGAAFGGHPGMDITDLTQMAAMMGLGPSPNGQGAGAGAKESLQIEEVEEEPKKKPAKAEEKKDAGKSPTAGAAPKPKGGAANLMMGRAPLSVAKDGSINVSSAALDPTAMLFGGAPAAAKGDAPKKK